MNGVVRDAQTGKPVAGAVLNLKDRGWGWDKNELIWDKERVYSARTAVDGSFHFHHPAGTSMSVSAHGYGEVETSPCSTSPMTVWIGGQTWNNRTTKFITLPVSGEKERHGWSFDKSRAEVDTPDLALESSSASSRDLVGFYAPFGMAWQAGAGNPSFGPTGRYLVRRTVSLFDCGWLHVRTAQGEIIVVRLGNFSSGTANGGVEYLTLPYVITRKPNDGTASGLGK